MTKYTKPQLETALQRINAILAQKQVKLDGIREQLLCVQTDIADALSDLQYGWDYTKGDP